MVNNNNTTNNEAGLYIFKNVDDFLKCMEELQEHYHKKDTLTAGFNNERNTI